MIYNLLTKQLFRGSSGGSSTPVVPPVVPPADTTAPTVTAFVIPATSDSYTIPVSTFTATDAVGVTGYLITESATPPLVGDAGWSGTAQTSYVVSADATYTLYGWAKDAAGNISSSLSDQCVVTLAAIVAATRVFVDQSLVTDVTDGTYNAGNTEITGDAYNTLQKALDNHVVGNHIILRGDTYTGSWRLPPVLNGASWTEGEYNKIESCNTTNGGSVNEWAVLDGNNDCTTPGFGVVLGYYTSNVGTSNYIKFWKIERLEIKNGSGLNSYGDPFAGGFYADGGPFWLKHCYIHDNNNSDPTFCNYLAGGSNGYHWKDCIVEYCVYEDNGGPLNSHNCKQITWIPDYANTAAIVATDTPVSQMVVNNTIKYNLVLGGNVGIGMKNTSILSPRLLTAGGYNDNRKELGDKIHNNICIGQSSYSIGCHGDFFQVHHNIIDACGEEGIRVGYDYVSAYPPIYKPVIYNNTFMNAGSNAILGMQYGYGTAAYETDDYKYLMNNIADGFGTTVNIGGVGEAAFSAQFVGTSDPDRPATNNIVSHNYSYRPASADQYLSERAFYTAAEWEAQTDTTYSPTAYSNAYDAGDLLFIGTTGVDKYKTNAAHEVDTVTNETVANGGYSLTHPYLVETIPSYVGAVDPNNLTEWVDTVYELDTLDVGIPVNLRDGVVI